MKRILALLIAIVMFFSLAACGNDDTANNINAGDDITSNGNGTITTETTNNNSESENKNDATESDITDITSETEKVEYTFDGTYELSFAEFDETILAYSCISSVESGLYKRSINPSIISFPSTKKPESPVIERFYTQDEFFSYLDEYVDMRGDIDSSLYIEMKPNKFYYTDIGTTWLNTGGAKIFNKKVDYYFIGHPDFHGIFARVKNDSYIDEVYYDNDTGNFYITFKDNEPTREKDSETTYCCLYITFDEEFTKSNKIGNGYLMYRK